MNQQNIFSKERLEPLSNLATKYDLRNEYEYLLMIFEAIPDKLYIHACFPTSSDSVKKKGIFYSFIKDTAIRILLSFT